MRTVILMLIAAGGLAGSAGAVAAPALTPIALVSGATDSSANAVWARRKLLHFTHPLSINSETEGWREVSCDQLYDSVKSVLLRFGAHPSDLDIDQRACHAYSRERAVDVTFFALAPADNAGKYAAGAPVDAQWERVELQGNCAFLGYITRTVLPLFTTRNVKLISSADCARLGVGLYAEILKPAPDPATSP